MFKKLFLLTVLSFFLFSSLNAKDLKKQCKFKGENYIFSSGECIEFASFEGDDNEHLLIIVHGRWDEGTNTLGRYAPFAETMNLNTDLTTIAIALPGYSNSSQNRLKSLASKEFENQAGKKEYALFLARLIEDLKKKYNAKTISLIGHSAGARIAAVVTGIKPKLIQNIVLAGGRYKVKQQNKNKGLIAFIDVINKANKDTNYLFVYGSEDKISKPELTTEFFKLAKQKGLKAKLLEIKGAGHIDLDMQDEVVEAFTLMLEQ